MRNVMIFDLDNCLSDDGWRIHLIDRFENDNWQRFYSYHCACVHDEPANLDKILPDTRRAIFTARPAFFHAPTVDWLARAGVHFDWLLMRNNHDTRMSIDVKRTQLGWFTSGEYDGVTIHDIVKAYDDRPEIVAMYHEYDLDAEVLAIHQIDPFTKAA